MKRNLCSFIICFTFIVVILFFSFNTSKSFDKRDLINPVIGDISFISKFGYSPDASTDSELRIITHLEYVEKLLRKADVSRLTREEKMKRNHLLDLMHEYWTTGVFPRNYDHPGERKPCFIDKDNRICAVGYLVEQTAGRQAAEQINSNHKYETIYEMNDASLDEWIANSGFTKEEIAMIQPEYIRGPIYTYNYIPTASGVTSALVCGLNLALSTANGIQLANGTDSKTAAILGIVFGAGQVVFAAATFPKEKQGYEGSYTNESMKSLCFFNLGLGTTTLIMSSWNLIANKKPSYKPTTWNIYSYPTKNKSSGLAVSLSHRF